MIAIGSREDVVVQAVIETPLGRFAIAASTRGLRTLVPTGEPADEAPRDSENPHISAAADALRAYTAGDPAPYARALDLDGTDFQLRVWRRMLAIPFGAQTTYGALATDLGVPGEARAVGQAVGANPVAILIPCHRVVGADGTLRGYAWGLDLKRRLLAHETAHAPLLARG